MTQPATAPATGLVGVPAACEYLDIKKTKLYELMASGALKSVSVPSETGRRRMRKFEQAELDRFIEANRVTA